jgi:hypothetical protein
MTCKDGGKQQKIQKDKYLGIEPTEGHAMN